MLRSLALRHRAIVVMVCALLLKAAVPMLASAAAGLRGVSVAQVCTVYGVATVPAPQAIDAERAAHADHGVHAGHAGHAGHTDHAGHADDGSTDHSHHSAAAHGGDHCALAGLVVLAAADAAAPFAAPPLHRAAPTAHGRSVCAATDSCALWVARLKQGPPGSA
jgi:hypothetical protein